MRARAAAITLGTGRLTIDQLVAVARGGVPVQVADVARERLRRTRHWVDQIVSEGRPVYGVTTGLGDLYRVVIPAESISELQANILMSHACGVGEPYPLEEVRAMMLLMAGSLAQGFSGARVETVDTLVTMLNRGVIPWVPQQGSVGYLPGPAHIGLVIIGRGKAYCEGELLPGGEAMRRAGIPIQTLGAKEGLAVINGTFESTALGALAAYDATQLVKVADVAGAMSLEALRGTDRALDPRIHNARPHPGQKITAANLRRCLQESEIAARYRDYRLQDALSLRSMPQVHGAVKDALAYVRRVVEIEMNSVTDNPILFPEQEGAVALSGGNGHGAPVALALDFLAIAVAELLSISERRLDRMTNRHVSELPAFLVKNSGLHSGFMIPQYTVAALTAENRNLATPASVENIPTSGLQEDHVSMGVTAARQVRKAVRNAQQGVAVELLAAAQGLEFHRPLRPGRGTGAAYRALRERIPPLEADRELHADLAAAAELVRSGQLLAAVEAEVGPLEVS